MVPRYRVDIFPRNMDLMIFFILAHLANTTGYQTLAQTPQQTLLGPMGSRVIGTTQQTRLSVLSEELDVLCFLLVGYHIFAAIIFQVDRTSKILRTIRETDRIIVYIITK